MAKHVWIVWNDRYHPAEHYRDLVNQVFCQPDWTVTISESVRDLLLLEKVPDLFMSLSAGLALDESPLDSDERQQIMAMVEVGMGCLFVHAALSGFEKDTHLHALTLGRFISHQPQPIPVTSIAIPGIDHPIMKDFAPFTGDDEHYFCQINLAQVTPFLCTLSELGTEIGGWSYVRGRGRVACVTPGHKGEILVKMVPLLKNAAEWCVYAR